MLEQLGRVIVGQADVIEQILAAIFTRGHCLLVGVPGLAKTLMVSSVAQILDVTFKRIQFTPDLMPSDITGTMVLDENEQGKREFRFVRGPVFANIVLADEINRTPPKTQAALLQSMQERQVSIGQDTHDLPVPFFVIATQNPIEQEGTYPLPEAQLDRFMFNVKVDYPAIDEEKRILSMTAKDEPGEVHKVLSGKAIVNLQKLVRSVPTRAGDPAQRPDGPGLREEDGRLRGRRPGRAVPDPGRQGVRRDGRPVQRGRRRHPEGRRAGPPAPDRDQLPGPGRGKDERGHHRDATEDRRRAGAAEVRGQKTTIAHVVSHLLPF
jgi:hypothetical protein